MAYYIIYRLINNFLYMFLKKIKFLNTNINFNSEDYIFLDLMHSTTHLGDRLFLWDLISFENSKGRTVYLNPKDLMSKELYSRLGLNVANAYPKHKSLINISLKPKLLVDILKKTSRQGKILDT